MKNTKFAWFIMYTFWTALISNGWWVLATQQLQQVVFVPIFVVTLGLSAVYAVTFVIHFIDALDER